ncbi:deoxyguanosinetriphosphate triphosphohydrolase family protein [Nocardia salmonicida]|uniref:deoxyguanosinetriphosphate triphosphohydrolase family protein n=1 Tax=Nocardia salmonicida TaxID=53431 RepID=UPI0007A476B0|nr:dNTP triphosphohydrolase [Nocardia salmonicida]
MSVVGYSTELLERYLGDIDDISCGGRSEFERDRDRILYSSAFRALGHKTQVVASTELGYVHNRLTHSLKVAQLGRSLASRLSADTGVAIDPTLVESACLAHDIGHPPFGHAGEKALNAAVDQLRRKELGLDEKTKPDHPLDGFEGNAQNLRILTRLATHRQWEKPGLHLTRATLAATTKYPWRRAASCKKAKKWGAYDGDAEALEWVTHSLSDDARERLPVEAQIMDWADSVTYAVHDMEDWYRQGLIPLDRLFHFSLPFEHRHAGRDESPELSKFLDRLILKWKEKEEAERSKGCPVEDRTVDRTEIVKQLHKLKDHVSVETHFDGTRQSKGRLQSTVTELISYFVNNVELVGEEPGYGSNLDKDSDRVLMCDVLKELTWHYVIDRPGLAAQQHGQSRIISDLVEWLDKKVGDNPGILPADRCAELGDHGDRTRVIADHIATLTEPMAIRLHGKLAGSHLGWITDTT